MFIRLLKNIVINKKGEPDVHIFGKGSKHRCTPLSKDIVPYYNEYCKLYHFDTANSSDDLLFYTVRNGIKSQMSQDNVQRFMRTYEKKAREINADLPHLHPHLWRNPNLNKIQTFHRKAYKYSILCT